jgi:hypothetical protein
VGNKLHSFHTKASMSTTALPGLVTWTNLLPIRCAHQIYSKAIIYIVIELLKRITIRLTLDSRLLEALTSSNPVSASERTSGFTNTSYLYLSLFNSPVSKHSIHLYLINTTHYRLQWPIQLLAILRSHDAEGNALRTRRQAIRYIACAQQNEKSLTRVRPRYAANPSDATHKRAHRDCRY